MATTKAPKKVKIDASKENCQKIVELFDTITVPTTADAQKKEEVRNFLIIVGKRLPKQKSIDKDRDRKKTQEARRKPKITAESYDFAERDDFAETDEIKPVPIPEPVQPRTDVPAVPTLAGV